MNIKSDGLQRKLKSILYRYPHIKNYFVFDMSFPETIQYEKISIPFLTRISEYESYPLLIGKAKGIWMDSFSGKNIDYYVINKYLIEDKYVSVVPPER